MPEITSKLTRRSSPRKNIFNFQGTVLSFLLYLSQHSGHWPEETPEESQSKRVERRGQCSEEGNISQGKTREPLRDGWQFRRRSEKIPFYTNRIRVE